MIRDQWPSELGSALDAADFLGELHTVAAGGTIPQVRQYLGRGPMTVRDQPVPAIVPWTSTTGLPSGWLRRNRRRPPVLYRAGSWPDVEGSEPLSWLCPLQGNGLAGPAELNKPNPLSGVRPMAEEWLYGSPILADVRPQGRPRIALHDLDGSADVHSTTGTAIPAPGPESSPAGTHCLATVSLVAREVADHLERMAPDADKRTTSRLRAEVNAYRDYADDAESRIPRSSREWLAALGGIAGVSVPPPAPEPPGFAPMRLRETR